MEHPAAYARILTTSIFALILFTANTAPAQIVTGSISGTVLDSSGAAVPEAVVKLRTIKTGVITQLSTDSAGRVVFPGLELGEYALTVEKSGFAVLEQKDIVLQAGERLALGPLALNVGTSSQVVSVTAEVAVVQTENSARTGVISSQQVANLLVIGRSVPALVGLLPGVVNTTEQDALTRNAAFSAQGGRTNTNNINVDGIQSTDIDNGNNTKLQVSQDAVAEVQILLTNYQAEYGSGSGAIVNMVTKSGTREFHGLASYFLKNEFFDANNFFNNRNGIRRPRARTNTITYNIGGPVSFWKFNPHRDKLFFFWNQEFWPTKGSLTGNLTVPTQAERAGDFSQSVFQNGSPITVVDPFNNGTPFPGNVIPANRLDPSGLALLKLLPLPNFTDRATSLGAYNYVYSARNDTPTRTETLKLDYNVSSRDRLSGTYTTFNEVTEGPLTLRGYFAGNWPQVPLRFQAATKGITASYTRIISPAILNELKFSWLTNPETLRTTEEGLASIQRQNVGFTAGQLNAANNPEGIVPAATFGGVPNFASVLGGTGWGRYRAPEMFDPNNLFTWTDNLSILRGRHNFKLGIQVQRFWRGIAPEASRFGNFDFGVNTLNPLNTGYAYANAALGVFNQYTETLADPYYNSRGGRADWFVQDTWKVTSRLTLDYGMRFYFLLPAYERDNSWSSFDPASYDPGKNVQLIRPGLDAQGRRVGVHPTTGQVYSQAAIGAIAPGTGVPFNGTVSPATDSSLHRGMYENRGVQFGPRFGFSWDPFGAGKTAIRGGFGVFYNPLVIAQFRPFTNQPPLVQVPTVQFGELSTLRNAPGLLFPGNSRAINFEGKVPTTMNFSFSIQQNVGFGTVLDVGYVGSLSRHLYWARNLNAIPYGTNFQTSSQDPTTGRPLDSRLLRPIPGYGDIIFMEPASSANYHSLQVSANRRFSGGLQYGLSYTWSKALEYASGDVSVVSTFIPVRLRNYGPSQFDATHVLRATWLWALPNVTNQSTPLKLVSNDWQISGIASAQSGFPFDLTFATQPSGIDISGSSTDLARPNILGSLSVPAGERTFERNFRAENIGLPAVGSFGNAGSRVLRGPGFANLDVAVFKNIPFGEQVRLQFRWELYNALNNTQFLTYGTSATFNASGQQVNPTFGQITAARSARRMQFALRLSF